MATVNAYAATDFRTFNLHAVFAAATSSTVTQGTPDLWTLRNGALPQPYEISEYRGFGLVKNAGGALIAGTITGWMNINQTVDGDVISNQILRTFSGLSIEAADWYEAHETVTRTDDLALLRDALNGSDTFTLSNQADYIWSAAGADVVSGRGGNDTLLGEAGNDSIYGGTGNDSLDGGDHRDLLSGNDGNDRLLGGRGYDTLSGGAGADSLWGGTQDDMLSGNGGNDSITGNTGNDTMTGGAGIDAFVFAVGSGNDEITDWEDGTDRMRVYAADGTSLSINVHYEAGDATVSFLDVTVLMRDVAPNSITLADFDLIPI